MELTLAFHIVEKTMKEMVLAHVAEGKQTWKKQISTKWSNRTGD
jgi:hypothetical protein